MICNAIQTKTPKRQPSKNDGCLALIVLAVIQQPNKGDYCSCTDQPEGMPLEPEGQLTLEALVNVPREATPDIQLEVQPSDSNP